MNAAIVSSRDDLTTQWPEEGLELVHACPSCGGEGSKLLYEGLTDRVHFCAPGSWTVRSCTSCDAAFLSPRPTRETIGIAYAAGYYTHVPISAIDGGRAPLRRRIGRALRNGYLNAKFHLELSPFSSLGRWVFPLFARQRAEAELYARNLPRPRRGARLLDLGCGNGNAVQRMIELGWDAEGMDVDEAAVRTAQAAGLRARAGDITHDPFPPETFDAITMNHVLEHVRDPGETLRACHRVLRPNGQLWIATPNISSIGHELAGRDWLPLDPPRHLVLFSPGSLSSLLKKCEFNPSSPLSGSLFEYRHHFSAYTAVRDGRDWRAGGAIDATWETKVRESNLRHWHDPAVGEELIVLSTKA